MRELKFRAIPRNLAHEQFPDIHPERHMNFVYGTGTYFDGVNMWLILNNYENKPCACIKKTIVKPETVGQFTGLHDKNGREIYEGDIVKVWIFDFSTCPDYPPLHLLGNYEVYYYQAECMYSVRNGKDDWAPNNIGVFDLEVIGNIHDNPELLEDNN